MTDQVKYTSKLKGAKALVIGGSSGIGFAVAEALIEHGATVTVSSSNPTKVESTVAKLKKDYPSANSRVFGHACNLGDASTAEKNIKALFEATGKLDHIVYTAGDALAMIPVEAFSYEKIAQAGQTRFFSPLLVAKYAKEYLSAGPKSSITFTGGVVAERPFPGWSVVAAYAAGMQGIVRGLAVDLKPIRVNVVQPGMVDTNIYQSSGIPDEAKQGMFAHANETLPVGRVGTPEDLAEAYLYLIKHENVTGDIVNSSGGQLLV